MKRYLKFESRIQYVIQLLIFVCKMSSYGRNPLLAYKSLGDSSFISTAGGFVIPDSAGNLIKAGAAFYGDSTILIAEARALRDGLRTTVEAGYMNIIIEGDNLAVIHSLKGLIHIPWQITTIIYDILRYLDSFDQFTIHHIFQEANMAADWLFKRGHLLNTTSLWSSSPSPELYSILYADRVGRTLLRRGV